MLNICIGYEASLDLVNVLHPAVSPFTLPPQTYRSSNSTLLPLWSRRVYLQKRRTLESLIRFLEMKSEASEGTDRDIYEARITKMELRVRNIQNNLPHNTQFGSIMASLGYRIDGNEVPGYKYGSTMDWCLIQVPESRVAKNEVSSLYKSEGRHLINFALIQIPQLSQGLTEFQHLT